MPARRQSHFPASEMASVTGKQRAVLGKNAGGAAGELGIHRWRKSLLLLPSATAAELLGQPGLSLPSIPCSSLS